MANPGKKHWEAVKGLMRYLRGTLEICICFGTRDACVLGYTDADFAGHPDTRRSTSGYVFTFVGGAVSWMSRTQKCVSLSTTEVEYIIAKRKPARRLFGLVGSWVIWELPQILLCCTVTV